MASISQPVKPSRRRLRPSALVVIVGPIVLLVAFVVGWQLAIEAFNVKPFVMPKPTTIWDSFLAQPGVLFADGRNTLSEALKGLLIGLVLGVAIAAATFQVKVLAETARAYSAALMAMPVLAVIPLADIFFGLAPSARIFVVALGTTPIIVVYTLSGLMATDTGLIETFRSCAASQKKMVFGLYLRSALPFVMSGLRIALPASFAIAIIGEYFGGQLNTLGTLIKSTALETNISLLWGAALMAFFFAAVLYAALVIIDGLLLRWHVIRAVRLWWRRNSPPAVRSSI
jgi:ABC-type nitrate/sulfonate/bicarbonate transport system permease component